MPSLANDEEREEPREAHDARTCGRVRPRAANQWQKQHGRQTWSWSRVGGALKHHGQQVVRPQARVSHCCCWLFCAVVVANTRFWQMRRMPWCLKSFRCCCSCLTFVLSSYNVQYLCASMYWINGTAVGFTGIKILSANRDGWDMFVVSIADVGMCPGTCMDRKKLLSREFLPAYANRNNILFCSFLSIIRKVRYVCLFCIFFCAQD